MVVSKHSFEIMSEARRIDQREYRLSAFFYFYFYVKGLFDRSLHRKQSFIENLDLYNFDSMFDMTEKGQIKLVGLIIFGFEGQ